MSTRHLTVTFVNRHCVYVSGHGSRTMLTDLRGRPPVYATRSHAWVTTEGTAADLIAVAERRGYEVVVKREAA